MRCKMNVLSLIAIAVLIASAAAQTTFDSAQTVTSVPSGIAGLKTKTSMISMQVENIDAAPVKGAPFCANITTEHTQLFADGNRIHTTDNSTLCRDSEGRTRHEANLTLLGPVAQKSSTKLVTIVDPVAGFRYVLDSNEKIARKAPLPSPSNLATAGASGIAQGYIAKAKIGGPVMYQMGDGNTLFRKAGQESDDSASTTENLEDQTIEGIHATGTRITTTIPAGKMGNEQPMLVTSERWYSPELKATVMTKHNDPWAGELKTQFTSVTTVEPDVSLFTVPGDYKIVDEKAGPFVMRLPPQLPPQ